MISLTIRRNETIDSGNINVWWFWDISGIKKL